MVKWLQNMDLSFWDDWMPYVIWLHLKIIINYFLCSAVLELRGAFGWETEVNSVEVCVQSD